MKALSIQPYFADRIASGKKKSEVRSWQTDHRGNLLICSSSYNDGPLFPRGHALCIVDLVGITENKKGYSWKLKNPRIIEPFPVKGSLHLFNVADEKIQELDIDYAAAVELWEDMGLIRDPTEKEFAKYYK